MPDKDLTTLICLLHHQDHAQAALEDVLKAGVPEANVTLIGPGSTIEATQSSLAELNVPKKDLQHLLDGLHNGCALLTVSAISSLADKVEAIFADHRADKIDEAVVDDDMSAQAFPTSVNNQIDSINTVDPVLPLASAGTIAGVSTLTDIDDEPSEMPAEPYNEPYDQQADVRVFRVVALPTSAMGQDALADDILVVEAEPLSDDFEDIRPIDQEDQDPRELGLDARMAPHKIVQVD